MFRLVKNNLGNKPFFSVIIPVFNRAHLVKATIDSVLEQDFKDYEIIAVDDGSTDRSGDVIQQYRDQVIYVRQENQGEGAARNSGIQIAQGEYLAFLDSDDLWFPWTLSTYKKAIDENSNPALVIGEGITFSDEVELSKQTDTHYSFDKFSDYYATADSPFFCACAGGTVVATKKAREVGGFFPMRYNASDQDFVFKLGTAPGCVHVTAPPAFAYRQHESNIVKNNDKNYLGISHIIETERNGLYPGSKDRELERLSILTRLFRAFSMGLVKDLEFGKGWKIYCRSLLWNVRLKRIRYILGFPSLFYVKFIINTIVRPYLDKITK